MKRQPPYAEANINHQQQQYLSGAGQLHAASASHRSTYASRPETDHHSSHGYERPPTTRFSSPHSHVAPREGQGVDGSRSYHQGQKPDSKLGLENQAGKEARTHLLGQDMEIGYDQHASPLNFEGLERKFHEEILKLAKEQNDAEDVEISWHRERIVEINTRYQEKLSALRAKQASGREEILRKESQARLSQYQQAGMSNHPTTGMQDARAYGALAVGGAGGELHRPYGASQFDSYRDRPQFAGGGRAQVPEGRVPLPEGRAYNNAGARYYQRFEH